MSEVLTWQDSLNKVNEWKEKGLSVGFTNGCFDILHLGHVTYLKETHKFCDRLVLGLNSDSSVKRLKGEGRPIHDERARAIVLSELRSVDLVVIFGEDPDENDKAISIINHLKPDIYFKGGDYDVSEIPEAPFVKSYGGDIKILSNIDGYSTSLAIEKSN
jgi:D-beta-D-heptose 7-phosphate kinase/D-beta-D-heptose 1-phosphate adenosyltransferase